MRAPLLLPPPRCEHCGSTEDVRLCRALTNYQREKTPHELREDSRKANELARYHDALRILGDTEVRQLPRSLYLTTTWCEIQNRARSLCASCEQAEEEHWAEMFSYAYDVLI